MQRNNIVQYKAEPFAGLDNMAPNVETYADTDADAEARIGRKKAQTELGHPMWGVT